MVQRNMSTTRSRLPEVGPADFARAGIAAVADEIGLGIKATEIKNEIRSHLSFNRNGDQVGRSTKIDFHDPEIGRQVGGDCGELRPIVALRTLLRQPAVAERADIDSARTVLAF